MFASSFEAPRIFIQFVFGEHKANFDCSLFQQLNLRSIVCFVPPFQLCKHPRVEQKKLVDSFPASAETLVGILQHHSERSDTALSNVPTNQQPT